MLYANGKTQPPESPFAKGDIFKSSLKKGQPTKFPLNKGGKGVVINSDMQIYYNPKLKALSREQ